MIDPEGGICTDGSEGIPSVYQSAGEEGTEATEKEMLVACLLNVPATC